MKPSKEANIKLNDLQEKFNRDWRRVLAQDAKDRNPYKKGDIIEEHFQIGRIKSVKIETYISHRDFCVFYNCDRLTKKLQPYRNGEECTVFLGNVKKQIAE